jgi:hypothetical protein
MSAFEYRKENSFNQALEVKFFCATSLFCIIIITCNLLELETISYVQGYLKNNRNKISVKKFNLFRFIVFTIIYLPVFFIKDPFLLQLVSGIIVCPTVNFIIPVS